MDDGFRVRQMQIGKGERLNLINRVFEATAFFARQSAHQKFATLFDKDQTPLDRRRGDHRLTGA